MVGMVQIIYFVVSVFGLHAQALTCPAVLEIKIHSMTYGEPGTAFAKATAYQKVRKDIFEYHQAVEQHMIEVAKEITLETFRLTQSLETKCEYLGGKDGHIWALIYPEIQHAEPIIKGHPQKGEESLRLVMSYPVNLRQVGREVISGTNYYGRSHYLSGLLNFYIWLTETSDGELSAHSFDGVSAMMKYQVDLNHYYSLFFYPLGLSSEAEVTVIANPQPGSSNVELPTATVASSQD